MTVDLVLDVIVAVLLLLGAYFSLAAAIGVIRFPDTLTRVHAGTKPQVLGLACILAAVVLSTRNWSAIAVLLLVMVFQMMTTPASAHMVGRAAYRAGQPGDEELYVDELELAVELANQGSNDDDDENADELDDGNDEAGRPPDAGARRPQGSTPHPPPSDLGQPSGL